MTSGRRAEYAEATRAAILAAARELFTTKGYFGTRVEDIARTARVSPATVYAVGGGKNGLIRELIGTAVHSEANAAIVARIDTFTDPRELIGFMVATTAAKFEQWSGLMRQVVAAAPGEPAVRESLELAEASLRNGLDHTARRLAELGALRPGLDAGQAADVLWFFLNNAAYFTLTDELTWPLPRAVPWLTGTIESALLS
ncbi:TetR/AcrR family transcriptional regulator [Actinoplanes sp. N902-109]|uniref:TetR/AcrR family transcriptional regulator n=1 Tax=Actinoplanes sp. (strain N902-109) TaxID=649831 RepID=UPI0003295C8F|nr:TetR/AcrR family transcriptional regulator [Actinoplanes sp. N902-109]AGL19671.1 TetR family transcriptional regulator [Actinoplanes sp. N902-109]